MTIQSDPTVAGFNCYVSLDEANTILDSRVDAANWESAGDTKKSRALLTATALIEQYCQFNGSVADDAQPLAWPRSWAPKHDRVDQYYEDTEIPANLQLATALYAEALVAEDLTEDLQTGLSGIRAGSVSLQFNTNDRKDPMPEQVQLILSKLGLVKVKRSGSVPLRRA